MFVIRIAAIAGRFAALCQSIDWCAMTTQSHEPLSLIPNYPKGSRASPWGFVKMIEIFINERCITLVDSAGFIDRL